MAQPARADVGIPASMMAILELDGFARWGEAFAPTRFGRMLADGQIQALMGPLRAGIQMGVRRADTDVDLEELKELVDEYRGRLQVGVQPSLEGFVAKLVLHPDGSTDLERLGELLGELVTEAVDQGAEAGEATIGGQEFTASVFDSDAGITAPELQNGALVAYFAKPFEAGVSALDELAGTESYQPSADLANSPMALHVDIERVMPMVKLGIAVERGERDAESVTAVLEAAGINELASFDVALRPMGEHVALDFRVAANRDPSGFLAAYRPLQAGRNPLVGLMPQNAAFWGSSTFRLDILAEVVERVMAALGEVDPMVPSFDDVVAQFEAETSLRLKEDLLDRTGSSIGFAMSAEALRNMQDPDAVNGLCYALHMRDGNALFQSLRTSFDENFGEGAFKEMFEESKFQGHRIVSMEMGEGEDDSASIGVLEDLVVFGTGPDGEALLRDCLTAYGERQRAGRGAIEFSEQIQARLEHAPRGWSDLAAVRVPAFLGLVEDLGDQIPPQARQVLALVKRAMAKYNLENLITVSGWEGARVLRQRILW